MRIKFIICLTLSFALNDELFGQFTNILIESYSNPNEPSISINPKNPNQIVAGANLGRVYSSNDGGLTWNANALTTTYGAGFDPCIIVDTAGSFYYFHINSAIDKNVCQKSIDGGLTWSNGTYPAYTGSYADKEWACVDWSNSLWRNNLYTTWTDGFGKIYFSKSINQGNTWSTPNAISAIDAFSLCGGFNGGAIPVTGTNGEIYVTWVGCNYVFQKSLDGGNTWLAQETKIDTVIPALNYTITGVNEPKALPSMDCDRSGGTYNGNIYVTYADQRNGSNNTDVFLSRSMDGGNTWTTGLVNNDAAIAHQFMPSLTVDQSTGIVYVVFYDRRNHTSDSSDIYLAYSINGGLNFTNVKISSSPSSPGITGHYIHIAAHGNVIRPIWTKAQGSTKSIWTALINYSMLGVDENLIKENIIKITPNPSSGIFDISWTNNGKDRIKIEIVNALGELLLKNEPGTNLHYKLDLSSFKNGLYFVRVFIGDKLKVKKIVKE